MSNSAKKYPCQDCYHCQWCSDERCRLCRKANCVRKLSLAEQVQLYEQINSSAKPPAEETEPNS